MRSFAVGICCSLAVLCTPTFAQETSSTKGITGPGVPNFEVRPGLRVDLALANFKGPRFLEIDDKSHVYVSRPNSADITTFKLSTTGSLEKLNTFLDHKKTVHGMFWADGWLYYTQSGSVSKARDTNGDGKADEDIAIIPEGQLPSGGGHWWRSICVTTDSLYTSIGDEGNDTDLTATDREKIWQYDKDGKNKRLFVSGIRNTEKLRQRPGTGEIWGCDHGTDWYGRELGDRDGFQPITDLNPPDELNLYQQGNFYGHPFITGYKLPRPEFYKKPDIIDLAAKTVPPEWGFHAHWAIDGFTFLTKNGIADDSKGDLLAASHGSWNSINRVGYCIQRVMFDKYTGRPYGSQTLVKCLDDQHNDLARPVDCLELPDGSVLFSSDASNAIYRISRIGAGQK